MTLDSNDALSSVTAQGGAIYNQGTLTITDSRLTNNTSNGAGGGLFNLGGHSATISNTVFDNNSSTARSGGGIANDDNGTLSIIGSTVTNNAASTNGGAVNNAGGTVTVSSTLFDQNSVSTGTSGGGVSNSGDGVMTITASTFTRNSGQGGSAILNTGSAQLTVTGSSITNHSSAGTTVSSGSSGVFTITNSTISSNTTSAGSTLGTISHSAGSLVLINNTITNNAVGTSTSAGGVFINGGTATLRNNVLTATVSNRADVVGDFISEGGNFIGNVGTTTGFTQPTDRTGTSGSPLNALLGPLVNYGGAPRTSTLQNAITSAATSLTLSSAVAFPNVPSFTIKIDSEQMLVTAVSGTTLTVTRGANGTTAASHSAGASVTLLSVPGITTPAFHSPLTGSPLIEAGVNGSNGVTDQRGAIRTLDADGNGTATTDIGAVEFSFVVTTTADTVDASPGDGIAADASGQTSLRAAIMEANALAGHDVIFIPSGTYTLTRIGTGEDASVTGDLDLTGRLTIVGAGSGTTIIDANGLDRVFQVASADTVQLSDLTVKSGNASGSGLGGGLLMQGSDLHLTRVIVANNNASDSGGGLYVQAGTAEIEDTTFRANHARNGGAIRNATGTTVTIHRSTFDTNSAVNFGGGFYVDGSATITNSLFTANATSQESGGGVSNNGSTTIVGCTFQGNIAAYSGGAILNENTGQLMVTSSALIGNTGFIGGAISNFGTAAITNTTISGNSVGNDFGAGILNRESGTLTLLSSTVTNNTGRFAGGIDSRDSGTVTIQNSIIVGNNPAGGDAQGAFISLGHNLIGNGQNATGFVQGVNGDLVGTAAIPMDAKLGPLQDNGGFTKTHALLATSPAIDAGQSDGVTLTDQRGLPRSLDGNNDGLVRPDIGAFELFNGFLVNSTLDTVDANPGDGIAADSMGRTTLRAAIMEANAHAGRDSIVLPAGTYTLTDQGGGAQTDENSAVKGDLDVTGQLIITGLGASNTVIDGAQIDRVFEIRPGAELAIGGLTIRNGRVTGSTITGSGGGLLNFGNLTLREVNVENNSAGADGGAIYNNASATLDVTGGALTNNFAQARGGAIANVSGTVTITDALIDQNSVSTEGNAGGLLNAGVGVMAVTSSIISRNSAQAAGGIYNTNSGQLTLQGSTLTNNTATGGGGAMHSDSLGTVAITDCNFSGNTAGTDGGAVTRFVGEFNVTRSLFSNNTAARNGGAIYSDYGLLTLTNLTVRDNTAGSEGGGVYRVGNGDLIIDRSTISSNSATGSAGGLRTSSNTTITNSTFSGNSSVSGTGAIAVSSGAPLTITNSTIHANTTQQNDDAGGIKAVSGGTATLKNTVVSGSLNNGQPQADIVGSFVSSGGNFIGHRGSVDAFTHGVNGDQVGSSGAVRNPLLGPLANNGGLTRTHAPLRGSPLIDAGTAVGMESQPTTDQRGAARTLDANGDGIAITDIGAVEFAFFVTTTADTVDANPGDGIAADASGQTSLRAAIMEANALSGYDVISVPAGTYRITRTSGADSGDFDITSALSIVGASAASTIIDARRSEGGTAATRVFDFSSNAVATLAGLTVAGGLVTGTVNGGGITNAGDLTLRSVIVRDNHTNFSNAAGASGGGIYSSGSLRIFESELRDNRAGEGGGVFAVGSLEIRDSRLTGNNALRSGGGAGGAVRAESNLTIVNSTFAQNSANRYGGGVYIGGLDRSFFIDGEDGAIRTIQNSTFDGNTGLDGGGGLALGNPSATVSSSTFSNNVTGSFQAPLGGGGIMVADGKLTATNITISGNTVGTNSPFGGGLRVFRGAATLDHATINQ